MKNEKRLKKLIGKRVTKYPELYLVKENGRYGDETWKLLRPDGKLFSEHANEYYAKENAVNHARFFISVPRDYLQKHSMKLAGYERLREDMLYSASNAKPTKAKSPIGKLDK